MIVNEIRHFSTGLTSNLDTGFKKKQPILINQRNSEKRYVKEKAVGELCPTSASKNAHVMITSHERRRFGHSFCCFPQVINSGSH